MDDESAEQGRVARPRARKPTFAERRERRAAVDDVAEVLDAAARFLEARPRSVSEVERKLSGMGYRPSLVGEVVERLEHLGYLDDEAFARAWVESRDRARPRGEHALRRELSQRGVDRTLVDEVLDARRDHPPAGADPHSPDEAAAARLLRKRLPSILREEDPRRRRQKAYALLARSGFSPDVCGSVTRMILAGSVADADPDDSDGLGADA
jgi:regulatory protein